MVDIHMILNPKRSMKRNMPRVWNIGMKPRSDKRAGQKEAKYAIFCPSQKV